MIALKVSLYPIFLIVLNVIYNGGSIEMQYGGERADLQSASCMTRLIPYPQHVPNSHCSPCTSPCLAGKASFSLY